MKALIFDMDGVIIDSEKVYEQVDQQWFAENGIKTDRIALRQCLGCTDDVNWGMIARWNLELDIAAAFQKYCAFCKDVRVNYEKIYRPYVQALIDQRRRCGILTALASSSPMDNIQTVLCDCQLEGQFDLVVSGCDLPVSKPDPAIFLQCAKQLGCMPAECRDRGFIERRDGGETGWHDGDWTGRSVLWSGFVEGGRAGRSAGTDCHHG